MNKKRSSKWDPKVNCGSSLFCWAFLAFFVIIFNKKVEVPGAILLEIN